MYLQVMSENKKTRDRDMVSVLAYPGVAYGLNYPQVYQGKIPLKILCDLGITGYVYQTRNPLRHHL